MQIQRQKMLGVICHQRKNESKAIFSSSFERFANFRVSIYVGSKTNSGVKFGLGFPIQSIEEYSFKEIQYLKPGLKKEVFFMLDIENVR